MGENHKVTGCDDCSSPLRPRLGAPTVPVHEGKLAGLLETTRLVSIELEVVWDGPAAGSKRTHRPTAYADLSPEVATQAKKWKATVGRDRYGPMGYELNMAPAGGKKFAAQAEDYQEAFIQDGIYVTDQCGGHVHTDARDMCIDDICKLLKVYYLVEPALYAMIPSYRTSRVGGVNPPCGKVADYYMDFGLNKVKGLESAQEFKQRLEEDGRNQWMERHCGLNLRSLFKHGTVEFRFPPAMLKAEDMVSWARLLTRLVDYAKSTKFLRLHKLMPASSLTAATSRELLGTFAGSPANMAFIKEQTANATKLWKAMQGKKLADILPLEQEALRAA